MSPWGQLDEAHALFEELRVLAAAHPAEAKLRLELAQGAFNLITALGNAGRIDAAQALLEELRALAADHPAEPELRLRLAKGAFNLIVDYGNAGQIDEARGVASSARDALLSAEFAALVREQFGEEEAAQTLGWLRSLLES